MESTRLPVNNDLVVRALNYHGQQLTSFMKDQPLFRHLDLKGVDYHMYHKRSRELRMEDRGRRLLLHRFISQNLESLFKVNTGPDDKPAPTTRSTIQNNNLLPPLETFMAKVLSKEDRILHFFDLPQEADILYCSVLSKNINGLILNVMCFAPESGKARLLVDLGIRCFCPAAEMIPAEDGRFYEQKDNVRVVILEVKREAQRLLVGMKYESFSTQVPVEDQVKLGLVTHNSQFPREFAASLEAREGNQPYDWFLQKSISFVNPNGVEELTKELGLSYKAGKLSLFSGLLHGSYDPSTTALALRNEQNSQMAFKHVALGIKYFKSGNNLEAFQCLNKALTIDKDNVEGLVARGALYANNGSLDRAIADFRKGLDLNPDHKNAKKYLSETLIAAARNHEDDKNYELALETYEKVLSMEPDHKIAKEAVWYLKQKIAGSGAAAAAGPHPISAPQILDSIPVLAPRDGSLAKEKKKKRRRSSSSSSSSSSSGSSSDSSRLSTSRKRRKKKSRKSRKTRDQKRSSSPLSVIAVSEGYVQPLVPIPVSQIPDDVPLNPYVTYPVEPRPISRVESELSRTSLEPVPLAEDSVALKKAEEQGQAQPVPVMPGPIYNLNVPPPGFYGYPAAVGYPPVTSMVDVEYERAVQQFLDKTSSRAHSSRNQRPQRDDRERYRDYDYRRRPSESDRDRRSRERDMDRLLFMPNIITTRRERETGCRERDSTRRSRDTELKLHQQSSADRESKRSQSPENILKKKDFSKMTVDEIAETVNSHYKDSLKSAEKDRSRSKSKERGEDTKEKDGKREKEMDRKREKDRSRSKSKERGEDTKEKDGKREKEMDRKREKDRSKSRSKERKEDKKEKDRKREKEIDRKREKDSDKKGDRERKRDSIDDVEKKREGGRKKTEEIDERRNITKDKDEERKKKDKRGFSPNAKRVFRMSPDDSSSDEKETKSSKKQTGTKQDSKPYSLWKPTGSELVGSNPFPLSTKELTSQLVTPEIPSVKSRLGPNTTSPFVIKLNKDTGLYTRMLKSGMEERVVRKLSRSPERAKSPLKSSRNRGREKSRSRERRSKSRDRESKLSKDKNRRGRSKSWEKDRKDRSKSRDRSRRDRSKSRDRSRRDRSKSRDKKRSKSREKSRRDRSRSKEKSRREHGSPERSTSRERKRTSKTQGTSPTNSDGKTSNWKEESDLELKGIRSGTDEIQREMERIQAEKAAILSQMSGGFPRPVPSVYLCGDTAGSSMQQPTFRGNGARHLYDEDDGFSSMDNVLSSVLRAVDSDKYSNGEKMDRSTAGKILPGATSYEDIQAYLAAAKREKIDKLREQNKGFVRPGR